MSETVTYDWAGRETSRCDSRGLVTTTSYATGRVTTVTLPGGATQVTELNPDGSLKSITGTGVTPEYHALSLEATANGMAYVKETITRGGANSSNVTVIVRDWLGRTIREERPNPAGGAAVATVSAYNEKGQLKSVTAPGRAPELYEYDDAGRQHRVGLDMNTNGSLVAESADQIQETASCYTQGVGGVWERTATLTYPADGDPAPLVVSETLRGPLTLTTGLSNETRTVDMDGNETRTVTTVDRAAKLKTVKTYQPGVSQPAVQVYRNGRLQNSVSPEGRTTTYLYDHLGRQTNVSDSASGSLTTVYTNGQVARVVDGFGNATAFEYEAGTGLRTATTDALTNHTYFAYDALGQLTRQWGDAAYPVSYAYDANGRMTNMTTYRGQDDFASASWPAGATGDVTTWRYDPATGLLTQKIYADEKGPSYSYNEAGQLVVRTWARATNTLTTTYEYDGAGRLLSVDYSDATPDVTYAYFRHGGPSEITDGCGTRTFTYTDSLKQAGEELTSGDGFMDWQASSGYEAVSGALGRRTGFALADTNLTTSVGYGYDVFNRLSQITSGLLRVGYRYQPNAPWARATELFYSNQWRMAHVDLRDVRGRVTNSANHLLGAPAEQHGYGLDALGRRTNIFLTGGSFWQFGYNDRSEVVLGQRKWIAASNNVAGQGFEYGFDPIGNRVSSRRESDESVWTVNELNQYDSNDVPGILHVMGQASTGASVSVTGSLAGAATVSRCGEYFHGTLEEANGEAAVWETTIVAASETGGVSAVTGHLFLARTPQAFTHDEDGNLTADGRWNYFWDAENRLTEMVTRGAAVTAGVPGLRLTFTYDYMGRRVRKMVDSARGTNWVNALTIHFAYDGWNLVRETRQGTNAPPQVVSHVWGLDLSGSEQGAGGVGGLLASVGEGGSGPGTVLFGHDANGNVTVGVAASNGVVVAEYEYGPFGEPLRVSGEAAEWNPFRFSTKYTDDETGLLYYGHRYYGPALGRWLNRDPLREFDLQNEPQDTIRGMAQFSPVEAQLDPEAILANIANLYRFANNDPSCHIDPNGKWVIPVVAGGIALTIAVIVLPDWDANSLSASQANKLAALVKALKTCADSTAAGYLDAMTVTGIFKPGSTAGTSVTRNGRFFGWGNRTILSPDYFSGASVEYQLTTLLHESYHAGTEDWTEKFSYTYSLDMLEKMKCCLQENGILK
jgi:RHS repeat-associated protein